MDPMTAAAYIIAAYVAANLFIFSLCRAASEADRQTERLHRRHLATKGHN